jgi:indolepyruvate ferredoxin oxidoreductase beta subunit
MPAKTKKNDTSYNVLFCGTGGQGVLTAAEICAIAAMECGYHVKKSEVHGMAQRGGSVESHLRFGKKIFAPIMQQGDADYLVCFHEGEGKRMAVYLKKNGVSFLPYLTDKTMQPQDKRFGNTFYLGMLSAFLPLTEESWQSALTQQLKRFPEENKIAFAQGREAGKLAALGKRR